MPENNLQLELITQKSFYDHWDSKKVADTSQETAVINFFKPYIDTIPQLALGEYYWQIFNNESPVPKILMVGGAIDKLTPYTAEQILDVNIETFFSNFYDLEHAFTFVSRAFDILFEIPVAQRKHLNISIYIRVKNGDGDLVWNCLQYPALYFDENGNLLYGLALYTNVNHLMKPDDKPMLTILNSTNKYNQVFTCITPDNQVGEQKIYPPLTKREKEIVHLLSQGKASKQIADTLGIKKNTVDNHRQRLLKKFGVMSSAELVVKAIINL